jgi:hypothetical protein
MNGFDVVSRIFYLTLIIGCLGLCIKECILNIKIVLEPERDTEATCSSENDISDNIV